jgi:ABC-2 type transport system ATP-binding protein
MDAVLNIQQVVKRYATKLAVDHISLQVPPGIIFGLLGPNGAGKTTLIRMITRITIPDEGQIYFNGEPLAEKHQRLIGYLPEERGLYKKMRVAEQIGYLLELKGLKDKQALQTADEWLERLKLGAWKNAKVEELSKGMQQKVQLIATIAHRPPVLILDEPFSGLDPVNSQMFEDVIRQLRDAGTSILFSTHRMDQLEELCQRIALIHNGKLMIDDDTKALRKKYNTNRFFIETDEPLDLSSFPLGTQAENTSSHHATITLPANFSPKDMIAFLNERYSLLKWEEKLPTLKEIFIKVVKENQPDVAYDEQ